MAEGRSWTILAQPSRALRALELIPTAEQLRIRSRSLTISEESHTASGGFRSSFPFRLPLNTGDDVGNKSFKISCDESPHEHLGYVLVCLWLTIIQKTHCVQVWSVFDTLESRKSIPANDVTREEHIQKRCKGHSNEKLPGCSLYPAHLRASWEDEPAL
jgi:hypothetical protein